MRPPKFKVGDKIKLTDDRAMYLFKRYNGHERRTLGGEILTISHVDDGGDVYGFAEDVGNPYAHWYNVETNFELAMPNWRVRLGGKRK